MQPQENPLDSIIKTATETMVKELYSDLKAWALSGIKPISKIIDNIKKKRYSNIRDLQNDISNHKIKNGDLVQIDCKFSSFGPFIKPLYVGPLVGVNTQNRLGPPLLHDNPFMGLIAQTTSNLIPVGIYPEISNGISQVRLYPSDSQSCGFFGLFPDIKNLVPSFNALVKSEYLSAAHKSCKLTGRIKCISQSDFVKSGFKLEDFEVLRSMNNIWFLDASNNTESNCKIVNGEKTELWGALYSAGHIEFEGEIPIKPLIDGYLEKLSPYISDLQVVQNQVKNREINIFGKGFRMVQHISYPIYALHYDIDIGTNYSNQKETYEKVLNSVLQNINDVSIKNSTKLINPFDLDFNYSNSEESYKLMESMAAKNIEDPLALAIKRWTKKKTNYNKL